MQRLAWVILTALLLVSSVRAETACLAQVSDLAPGVRIHRAALGADEVGLTFVGHSTFLIESPKGVRIATDYNDHVRPRAIPDIATMNHAHDTHFSTRPDSRIVHVLKGWSEGSGKVQHDLPYSDTRVRSVPTNIRSGGTTEFNGNSIFIFEISGLCIAHLGHLHHTLTGEHLKAIGQLDVVLVPVDGSFTMDMDGMIEVLQSLNAPLMIPMHYFGQSTLNRFIDRMSEKYDVKRSDSPAITLSRATLPMRPTVMVLPGR